MTRPLCRRAAALLVAATAACASPGASGASGAPGASGAIVSTAPSSMAPSSTAPSSTAGATNTTTSEPTPERSVAGWLSVQRTSGFGQVVLDPTWASLPATLITAYTTSPRIDGEIAIALADGRVATLPDSIAGALADPPTGQPNMQLTGLGGDPLLVYVAPGGTIMASRLDPATLTWSDVEGLSPLRGSERLDLYTTGEHALFVHWDNSALETYRQWGEVVSADGSSTRMTDSPADTPMWFTDLAAGRAFLLGFDTASQVSPDLPAPVSFDPLANAWQVVPTPDWVACGDECQWSARHEGPDPQFSIPAPAGIVVFLPDGSYGVLDPEALTWRRVDDPPIPLPGPVLVAVGDGQLLALPGASYEGEQAIGTGVWLDLATGTWRTQQLIDAGDIAPPVRWEPRWWGDVLLLGADADEVGNPPSVAVDLTTGEVRPPTGDELTAWPALQYQPPIDDLITAWELHG